MKFEDRHEFDRPRDVVLSMFSDRAFFENKYAKLDCKDVDVLEHERKGDRFRIKCRFMMKSSAPVPAFARKFVAERNEVTQQDSWDLKAGRGRLDIHVRSLPVKVSAEMTLVDTDRGCANQFVWEVKSSVPLIGSKLEQVLAEDIRLKSAADLAVSRSLLEDY